MRTKQPYRGLCLLQAELRSVDPPRNNVMVLGGFCLAPVNDLVGCASTRR